MTSASGGDVRAARLWLVLGALVLVVMSDPFQATWYDENYSEWMFVRGGAARILTDYHLPNNHVLYNLLRHAWSGLTGDSVLLERCLTLVFAILAALGVFVGVRRIADVEAAAGAALVFSTSHVVAAFAAQLRGYSLSMALLAWAFVSLTRWRGSPASFPLGYAVLGACAIGVVPTNAIVVAGLAIWSVLDRGGLRPPGRPRQAACLASPVLGLLIYASSWESALRLMDLAAVGGSGPGATGGASATLVALLGRDCWLAVPLVVLANVVGGGHRESATANWLGACALVPLVGTLLVVDFYPRVFVPALVPLAAAQGMWLSRGMRGIERGRLSGGLRITVIGVIILAAAAAREASLAAGAQERWAAADGRPQNLVDQYYRSGRYRPDLAVAALRTAGAEEVIVVHDDTSWDLAGFFRAEAGGYNRCAVDRSGRIACVLLAGEPSPRLERLLVVHWNAEGGQRLAERAAAFLGRELGNAGARSEVGSLQARRVELR